MVAEAYFDVRQSTLPPMVSAAWRELIKRIWEIDPLLCPQCGAEMAKIAVIKDPPNS